MSEKTSVLLSDVTIKGDIVEKDRIVIDAKVNGDIKSEQLETHSNSNIKGNIKSKHASLGGKVKGNVNSDLIKIKKTADIDGVLNQKIISFGWKTLEIKSGNNMSPVLQGLNDAIELTKKGYPICILLNTEMGSGIDFMMGSHEWHGIAPNDEQLKSALKQLEETLGDF